MISGRLTSRRATALVLALFGLVLLASPYLHHDFGCHEKTPTHCTSCVSHPLALRAELPRSPLAPSRDSSGTVEIRSERPAQAVAPGGPSGRAPPA